MTPRGKFLCICTSPAIDATVVLPSAPKGEGEIFKDVAETENVGGKAVNVARYLALRGAEVACGGLLGEENDAPFRRELAKHGIADVFLRVPGATRRNEMISWPGGSVKLNRPAFPGLAEDPFSILERLAALPSAPVAVLSGSLPPSLPAGFYANLAAALKERGFAVALDASGEAMRLALDAKPDVVKPNAEECEALVGFVPDSADGFRRATDALRRRAAHAIISDGGRGAWFDGEFVPAPEVEVLDTTAAGDTLLAEWCWRVYACGESAPDAARWAVAAGSAACTMPGGAPPPFALVERLRFGGFGRR